LLFPLELYFSVNEIELIKEIQSSLENLGFIFDSISADCIIVSGLPVTITESQISIIFDDLLNDFQNGVGNDSFSQNDSIAQSMAKCLAVKTGICLVEKE
jgi:DNA mismatch repair protein MutL